ncbi:MAG: hypothetical protein A2898_03460 [Candidatus Kerfeldbacteria bacterium RIFCSPLOWO2_01_FULL_48_11]|uniref:FCP1 homology domain-containing protein n=1 Tax=Candidatus Kerfeldbacteria bacterium RIFCSPLOWO2_01_FULL_48_11 TaxID=1798543 RepID=A0A1G2B3V2_9BACT|nr:MAG: hypothetical protein UY34_C0009G0038 [Parcubacteria group bacterium GW2011_GWA2_48_9]KKW16249.1 MAG: hypothetical protein UY52_C0007G0009 [Parcubacteria group bacterium GW2011_GWC2_49_9]OGY83319.1 MAG: hypothetical protein A2898_03460 [Candidatus Kerfeldbacteria bacterium RIFCSPLOWO2_01_FULL_48_11]HCM68559.1 hypothetical protein [Candidatus Kerfeldbacteria bacterium]
MNRPVIPIGLDFGGVIAHHLATKCAIVLEMFGLDILPGLEATRVHLLPRLGEPEYLRMTEELSRRTSQFPLHIGVLKTLTMLVQTGFRFCVISTQTVATTQNIWEYIRGHQLPIEDAFVVTNDADKLDMVRATRVRMYCDDNTVVLDLLRPAGISLVWANLSGLSDEGVTYPIAHSWEDLGVLIPQMFN